MNSRFFFIFWIIVFSFFLTFDVSYAIKKLDTPPLRLDQSLWESVRGQAEKDQIHLGMLSYHISTAEHGFRHNWKHSYFALFYDGFFVGTLINSRYNRSYLAGISRRFYQKRFFPDSQFGLGYSLGAISGYDKKSFDFAEKTPLLPFFSLNASFHYKKVGAFFGWCAFVFYTTFSVSL